MTPTPAPVTAQQTTATDSPAQVCETSSAPRGAPEANCSAATDRQVCRRVLGTLQFRTRPSRAPGTRSLQCTRRTLHTPGHMLPRSRCSTRNRSHTLVASTLRHSHRRRSSRGALRRIRTMAMPWGHRSRDSHLSSHHRSTHQHLSPRHRSTHQHLSSRHHSSRQHLWSHHHSTHQHLSKHRRSSCRRLPLSQIRTRRPPCLPASTSLKGPRCSPTPDPLFRDRAMGLLVAPRRHTPRGRGPQARRGRPRC